MILYRAATFIKRSKKIELNVNTEFGRVVLFRILTSRKGSGISYSIPVSGRWNRNRPITLITSLLKTSIYKGGLNGPVLFFIPSRLSYKQIKRTQLFLHKFAITFMWSPDVFHPVPARRGSCLFKAGSQHSQDNIFHINTSPPYEKHPTLIFLYMSRNYKTSFLSFLNHSFLKRPTNQSCLKKRFIQSLGITLNSKPAKL